MAYEKLRARWAEERRSREARSEALRRRIEACGPLLFRRYHVQKAVLFGSAAEGRSSERSDVDLFVTPLDSETYWELRRELEEALGAPVDLYTEGDDPTFTRKVLTRGIVVYAAQP
ncbi:MAG: nucleotidyltransferase domain-containing protein [Thermodesulfobacteriota bacterium]|jgi:predicted nucleotidyltransferase